MFWTSQAKRKKEPSSVSKMAIGCLLLGFGFVGMALVTLRLGPTAKISFILPAACTLLYTVGELYLSPIGLSLVTKVAPARLVGMMMGMWFLSSFFGNYLSGYLGTYYETMAMEKFFLMLAALAVLSGLAIFALQRPLKNAVGHNV